jgi:hypothetical protein
MTRIQIDLPDKIAVEVERRAEKKGVTAAHYVADLVEREVGRGWPEGFFEKVVGTWQGEPLERPPQPAFEEREEL